ncbi:MAG: methyltransferase domain-containing protein [Verrucomicrobiae bacterium]|nr:methyltransferase domain-containing protein [Verrucomicrobiae bacterium]
MFNRLRHYAKRYGYIHAIASFIGRKSDRFWQFVGPIVTSGYLKRWKADSSKRILNLGGGSVLDERWLTADITPRADVWADVTRPLPFNDSSVDIVYLEEVIEHVSQQDAERMLSEIHRILKSGGSVRITTPSLDYFVSIKLDRSGADMKINNIFYLHGHRRIYSESSLKRLLEEAGFRMIRQSYYRDPNSPIGDYDSHHERFPEYPAESSQYWDAVR